MTSGYYTLYKLCSVNLVYNLCVKSINMQNASENPVDVPEKNAKISRKIAVNCAFWLQNGNRIWYNPSILR